MNRKLEKRLSLGAIIALSELAQARPGGGSSYRSSSSGGYRSSSSSGYRSSGSSYRGSSSSYRGGSSSHSGGGGFDGSDLFWTIAFTAVVSLVVIGVLVMASPSSNYSGRATDSGSKLPGQKATLFLVAPLALLVTPLLFKINFALGILVPVILLGGILKALQDNTNQVSTVEAQSHILSAEARPVGKLDALLLTDPNFSLPVFREFAVMLYCQAMQERGKNFVHSRPFLSPAAARTLSTRGAGKSVTQVVVGCCHLDNAWDSSDQVHLKVTFESNYVEESGPTREALIANETWIFTRQVGLLTQPPQGISKLACPGCGYSGEFPSSGECPQCNRSNQQGNFDWVVSTISLRSIEKFNPVSVQTGGMEAGTDLPTRSHPSLGVRRREFFARHPEFTVADFQAKVSVSFLAIYKSWMERDWNGARPYMTDSIFRTHLYWIEDYRRRGQVNRLEDIQLSRIDLSNVIMDAFYESLTVRIFASARDYTVDEKTGAVLSGDPQRARIFSEYWTFIRRVGHKPSRANGQQCPACGAPLDRISQAGVCEYCQSVITKGDFDWVLSNIEQDEVYQIAL